MVFQEFNLFPHLRVIDNLIEAPIRVKGVPRDQAIATAERYLAKVGLSRQARRVPVAAVRRPEAARGHRPGADDGAQGAAVRRADVGPRPDARRRGAQRDGGPRARGRDDDRGHPRDGVRPRGRRPRLLHRRGRVRRGRPARAGHRQPAATSGRASSSPARSARPTSTRAARSTSPAARARSTSTSRAPRTASTRRTCRRTRARRTSTTSSCPVHLHDEDHPMHTHEDEGLPDIGLPEGDEPMQHDH